MSKKATLQKATAILPIKNAKNQVTHVFIFLEK